jgi:cellulose synthase/poly-beta-1,6-N-acetylglucosamine synthase-like glycosyltransferase
MTLSDVPTFAGVDQPSLSVVVIGRNEGERLVRCLESVRAMHWPQSEVELIYVDSASQDDSPQCAAALRATVIVARSKRPCAAVGRNLGWRQAKAPLVLFLDGDTILHPDFVAQAAAAFADPRVAVVWGHRRELYPQASIYHRVLDLDWVYLPGPSLFCGGDALMRRTALAEVGGYDGELIAGEEPELCQRMRARGHYILHIDTLMTQHDLAITRWSQYWRRAQRAGYAYAAVANRPAMEGLRLWVRDARRNIVHTLFLGFAGVFGLTQTLATRSLLPLLLTTLLFSVVIVRTAYRARWKDNNLFTLFLYGVHTHLQQFPIFIGQLGYWRDYWGGRKRALMEYKEVRS